MPEIQKHWIFGSAIIRYSRWSPETGLSLFFVNLILESTSFGRMT